MRQIRNHIGNAYAAARHYAHRLDQGVNLASRVISAAHPILKDIAPAYEQKSSKGAAQAKESYATMTGDVVDLHSRGAAHAKRLGDISSMSKRPLRVKREDAYP